MENNNLELWRKVEKTNPKYTKNAKKNGNSITSIAPQYQIMNVTEQFGSYGKGWGFKNIELDYSLTNLPHKVDIMEGKYPNQTKVGEKDTFLGIVIFKAIFFYPEGEFPIINSIKIFTDNMHSKIDEDFAKKVETDALTKAVSKLGFNADIFLGKFDDLRYLEGVKQEFSKVDQEREIERYKASVISKLEATTTLEQLKTEWSNIPKEWQPLFNEVKENQKNKLTNK